MNNWKIITLGTSHGDPTRERFNASTLLLAPSGNGYLVDAGTPALGLLIRKGFDLNRLKAVIITHMHEDHFGGVPDLLKFQCKRLKGDSHTDFYFPEEAAIEGMKQFMALAHRPLPEQFITLNSYSAGWIFQAEDLQLKAIPTDHMRNENMSFPSYAFYGNLGSKRLLMTGDLCHDLHDFPADLPADLAICELTHYIFANALPLFSRQRFEKLVFTHVGNEWHGAENEQRLAKLANALPYPWHLAKDGDEFELND